MTMNWLWQFPMKPVKVVKEVIESLDPSKWTMESKADGWRCIVTVDKFVRLWTRQHTKIVMPNNLGEQLTSLNLPVGTVLDGEIWTPTKRGSWRHDKTVKCDLTLWDVLSIDNRIISNEPIEDRRDKLNSLVSGVPDIHISDSRTLDVGLIDSIKQDAYSHRNESRSRSGFIHGIVLKRNGSPRRDHAVRSVEHADWLKLVFEGL